MTEILTNEEWYDALKNTKCVWVERCKRLIHEELICPMKMYNQHMTIILN